MVAGEVEEEGDKEVVEVGVLGEVEASEEEQGQWFQRGRT